MSDSRKLIMEGMQEGGGISGPSFDKSSGEADHAGGLRAVRKVFEERGENGIKALRLGQASAKRLIAKKGKGSNDGPMGFAAKNSNEDILKRETEKAYRAIMGSGKSPEMSARK